MSRKRPALLCLPLRVRALNLVNRYRNKIRIAFHAAHTVITNFFGVEVALIAFAAFNALPVIQYAAPDLFQKGRLPCG